MHRSGAPEQTARITPAHLNAAIAVLFITGSACFVVGSFPSYLDAVGETADGVTFVVGSVFFTTASFAQLLQANTPAMTDVDEHSQHRAVPVRWRAWLPRDRAWLAAATQFPGTLCFNVSTVAALSGYASAQDENRHVWRPDVVGSTLFLISSWYAVLALGRGSFPGQVRTLPGEIAWLNMLGSVLFGISALGAFVLPSGSAFHEAAAVGGTLLGAACFLAGAALMFPAWSHAVRPSSSQGEPT